MRERVVVDTNVFVSGLLRLSSVPGRAASNVMDNSVLLVSHSTMSELADILGQAKFDRYVSLEQRLQFIALIANKAEFVPIIKVIRECRDPKDDKFLEVALNGRADVILTGDSDLLEMHPWRGIEILSPTRFLQR
jgi:uncharacterized protein